MLDLSNLEIDFILTMYSKDHPDEFKYSKQDEPEPLIFKLWTDKLRGKTLGEFSRSPLAYMKKYFKDKYKP